MYLTCISIVDETKIFKVKARFISLSSSLPPNTTTKWLCSVL
jgi:hypothetical protein